MSGGADRRRTIPLETEDDEERAKRQRTEKKTELEMEVSNVAKINDRRRILDLRRDGWEPENIRHRDAAMFCACELRPRVIRALHQAEPTGMNMGSMPSTRDTRAGIRVRIRPQHRRRSHFQEHPEQHRVQCHDHPWKRHRTVNISHLERRQHPPPFVESHEGNWTAEQPGH